MTLNNALYLISFLLCLFIIVYNQNTSQNGSSKKLAKIPFKPYDPFEKNRGKLIQAAYINELKRQ